MSTEKSAAELAAASAQPGHFHTAAPVSASVPKAPPAVAPPATPAAAPKVDVVANATALAALAARKAAAAKAVDTVNAIAGKTAATQGAALTHVLVPVETLKAIHAQLSAQADTIAALLPTVTPEQAAEAVALATASRLKQQAVQGK